MEGGGVSVSNVELCNLAYAGRLDDVKECLAANRSLATRADQVGLGAFRRGVAKDGGPSRDWHSGGGPVRA